MDCTNEDFPGTREARTRKITSEVGRLRLPTVEYFLHKIIEGQVSLHMASSAPYKLSVNQILDRHEKIEYAKVALSKAISKRDTDEISNLHEDIQSLISSSMPHLVKLKSKALSNRPSLYLPSESNSSSSSVSELPSSSSTSTALPSSTSSSASLPSSSTLPSSTSSSISKPMATANRRVYISEAEKQALRLAKQKQKEEQAIIRKQQQKERVSMRRALWKGSATKRVKTYHPSYHEVDDVDNSSEDDA